MFTSTSRPRNSARSAPASRIGPNASRLLLRLGLGHALDAYGVRPVAVHSTSMGMTAAPAAGAPGSEVEAEFGAPTIISIACDLAALLAAALPRGARACRPPAERPGGEERVRDRALREWRLDRGRRAGGRRRHTQPRARANFRSDAPRFTGCTAWRGPRAGGAHRPPRRRGGLRTCGWGRAGIACTTGCRRGDCLNVVCIVERSAWTAESWTDRGNVADVLAGSKAGIPWCAA
jgi:salicylate hydroxylase